ncbi:hypothetical protein [Pontiella sulfatireligans]|uniref:Lipoprotein n=1 Tax=Pontiella sulfatireligans TaxID=2750658 RepID=A0A6C2UKA5_9BACT|nr:hypothetical protein [Pontiella sulfatireligans]VGO19857.1 hypothetical protein SCARR_01917 [Pontiella sulfatireligans]
MSRWMFLGLAGLTLLTGCSTTSMKGTPFYTGEYAEREGPAADRVNVWPLLYYRDPALSVLWPLMEFSPDHLAVRPFYSVYGREDDTPVRNVLWPVARFDPGKQKNRIFPVYWGDEYFNVWPLYWHKGDPFSGTGRNALFPLWIWNNKTTGSTLHVLWPFYANYNERTCRGWRLWPLYGAKDSPGGYDRFWAWPLIHFYENSAGGGQMVLPLWYRQRKGQSAVFYSLPWWSVLKADGSGWSASFPFYYNSRSEDGSVVITPLYAQKRQVDGALAWKCFIPFVYFDQTKDAHFMTPLGGAWRMGDEHRWLALPLLSGGRSDADSSRAVCAAGLVTWEKEQDTVRKSRVFPVYWWEKDSSFYTALYGRDRKTEYFLTPLVGRRIGDQSGSWVFPLYDSDRSKRYRSFGANVAAKRLSRESKTFTYLLLGRNSESWNYDVKQQWNSDLLASYRKQRRFWPLYSQRRNERYAVAEEASRLAFELKESRYLLLASSREDRSYDAAKPGGQEELIRHETRGGVFPLWKHTLKEDFKLGSSEETSSYLGFLFDARHEKQTGEEESAYVRRRVLWRLYHHENLNGDASTDVFPAITVDSYKNGYYKCSVFWRLFRYEKDPENGTKKLDLLFIPLRR